MIKKLYIDKEIKNNLYAVEILKKFKLNPISIDKDFFNNYNDIDEGKKTLFLTYNKGSFLKKCPGTNYYNCCDYQILHIANFCTMDCSYCILQSYFKPPILQFFVNYNDMLSELDNVFKLKKINRIGTGEFTDSLIWEKYINISNILVKKFSNQTNSILELKSKSTNLKSIENLNHREKTVLSWSLNTKKIVDSEERKTSPIIKRLEAAKKAENLGYKIAFHFDPIIIYENCEKEYLEIIDEIFKFVSSKNIVYISLGTLRFMPALSNIISQRFKNSKIQYGEFILGLDNKMRYFKPLRIKIYKKLIERLKDYDPDLTIYFCMEDDEVWEKCLNFIPKNLGDILDESVKKHCKLKI